MSKNIISENWKNKYKFLAGIIQEVYEGDSIDSDIDTNVFDLINNNQLEAAGKELYSLWKSDKDKYTNITNELINQYKSGNNKEKIKNLFQIYFTTINTEILKKLNYGSKDILNKEGDDFWIFSILNSLSGQQMTPASRREIGMGHLSNFDLMNSYSPGDQSFDDYLFRTLSFAIKQYFKQQKQQIDTVSIDAPTGDGGRTVGDKISDSDLEKYGDIDFWDPENIDLSDESDAEELAKDAKMMDAEDAADLYNAVKAVQKMASGYLKTITDPKAVGWSNWYEDSALEGENTKQLIQWIPNWERYDFPRTVYHNWIKSIILPEYLGKKYGIVVPGYSKEGSIEDLSSNQTHANKYLSKLAKSKDEDDKALFNEIDKLMRGILSKDSDTYSDVAKFVTGDRQNLLKVMNLNGYPNENLDKFISDSNLIEAMTEIARKAVNGGAYNILKLTNLNKDNPGKYREGWVSRNRDRINALVSDELFAKMMTLAGKAPVDPKRENYPSDEAYEQAKNFHRALAITQFQWKDAIRQAKERERAPKKKKDSVGIPTDDFGGVFQEMKQILDKNREILFGMKKKK